MPILPSRAREIQRLLSQLGADSPALRESAVARLTLVGERAVGPLLAFLGMASPLARLHALRVLEQVPDPRALPEVLALLREGDPDVARKAIEVSAAYPDARTVGALAQILASGPPHLHRGVVESLARLHAGGVVEAIDPLLDVLMDEGEEEELRMVALEAVSTIDRKELTGILRRLRGSGSPGVGARAAALEGGLKAAGPSRALTEDLARLARASAEDEDLLVRIAARGPEAADPLLDLLLERADEAVLAQRIGRVLVRLEPRVVHRVHRALARAERPAALKALAEVLGHFKAPASIPALHHALERLSAQGARGADSAAVAEAKARIHLELAGLGSRIALYDLREMLSVRPVLAAPTLLEAAARVGDATLVPAIAALAADEAAAADLCARALAAIVRREGLRRNSRALRSLRSEHRAALDRLWRRAVRSR